jgi:hypothetical protein
MSLSRQRPTSLLTMAGQCACCEKEASLFEQTSRNPRAGRALRRPGPRTVSAKRARKLIAIQGVVGLMKKLSDTP